MIDRPFLAANPHWRRDTAVIGVQIATLSYVVYLGVSKWLFVPPRMGAEIVEPKNRHYRLVRLL
jgi:hypothetical protein